MLALSGGRKVNDNGNVISRGHFGQEMQRFRFGMLSCAVLCSV